MYSIQKKFEEEKQLLHKDITYSHQVIDDKNATIKHHFETIRGMIPAKQMYDSVMENGENIDVETLAKIISGIGFPIGRNELFAWLRKYKFLETEKHKNNPYQKWIDKGFFTVKMTRFTSCAGITHYQYRPFITPKGQAYFIKVFEKLKSDGLNPFKTGIED